MILFKHWTVFFFLLEIWTVTFPRPNTSEHCSDIEKWTLPNSSAPIFTKCIGSKNDLHSLSKNPEDNFGTVVGENLSCYGILPLWAVNGLSIVCWEGTLMFSSLLKGLSFTCWPLVATLHLCLLVFLKGKIFLKFDSSNLYTNIT